MKPVPYEYSPDDEIEVVMEAFGLMFDPAKCQIFTKDVSKGGTSDIIYVQRGTAGKRATVIIWDDKTTFYDKGKVVNKDGEEL